MSLRDEDLGLYQVDAGGHFRNRVFNLNTRVHFDEIVVAFVVDQEFHGAGAAVVHSFCDLDGVFAKTVSQLLADGQGRCEFNDLLVTSLDGTVTLAQVYDVAVVVAQYLHFDVLRPFDVFLDKDIVDSKSFCSFTLGAFELHRQFFLAADDTHAASAAAGCCLEHDRIAAFVCKIHCSGYIRNGFCDARNGRHANGLGDDL